MSELVRALVADHLLSLIVFVPVAGALALLFAEWAVALFQNSSARFSDAVWKLWAIGISLVGLLLAAHLWSRFDAADGGMQFVEHAAWIGDFGIAYYLGVDGVSLPLVALTAFLLPIVLLASWSQVTAQVRYYVVFMLALQSGMLGAFLSLNLFLFYVFWEALLIPMYFVIGIWGGRERIAATLKFFLFTMAGSVLMLVAVFVLAYLHHQAFGVVSFDYVGHAGAPGVLDTPVAATGAPFWQRQDFLFALFALSFAIKVPLFPLHTWLPAAHVEAPTAGSAILAGVLLKLGTFGFVRYAIPLFPVAAAAFAPWMLAIAAIGVVYGALLALAQSDVKRLVAYSSISHMGLVVIGLFVGNVQGLEGAVLQMVNHGLTTAALFIGVGMLYERRGVREISDFGGLATSMPLWSAFLVVAALASIGVPLLNGFVGEVLILLGAFAAHPWIGVAAASGVVLGAVYTLWMLRRVVFGPLDSDANRKLLDLGWRERIVAVALVVPMFWIGVHPISLLDPMDRTINGLLEDMAPETEPAPSPDAPQPLADSARLAPAGPGGAGVGDGVGSASASVSASASAEAAE